ncbi:nucleotidyltransferase domain-containing protein [Nitrospina gracilis]|uniref:nucleotidyltransferase domain-containing protein n=1 Tax=Nitrospina gracilis TaxID=35801 RepID=UPI001F3977BB|nr:nucleotidyltransferase [Nitrospina gracilis]MCF8721778.1 hypothetical protein [Nitrospina gracilis Nb-211]
MAELQKYFEQFHKKIRFDNEDILRKKRDCILNRIRKHLSDNDRPGFKELLQGSYKYKVGINPIAKLEFDIDVGLRFDFAEDDYTADEVRSWVLEAVDGHTDNIEGKGPCIRVSYSGDFHVDLILYANWEDGAGQEQFRLAHKKDGWVKANPVKLEEIIKEGRKPFEFTEDSQTGTDQLRRVVRYLKRWNDNHIPNESDDKPIGLGFLLLCIRDLEPTATWDEDADDLGALKKLARSCSETYGRIVIPKPVELFEDVFGRISDKGMDTLKKRFKKLAGHLEEAENMADPVKACKLLRDEEFGPDFPVPDSEDTGKKTSGPAIVTSSSSA